MLITFGVLAALSLTLCDHVLAASGDNWRSRTIYQVLTDRFALDDGSTSKACNTGENGGVYCGGTWNGLTNKLDYIQGMGFDAVWISPITQQLEGNTPDGSSYHGYWQTNINKLNAHFGSADDLKNLAAALHSRGMYLMVDVVVNHFAWYGNPNNVDYSTFGPFNNKNYFHPYCSIDFNNLANTTQLQQCWMGDAIVPLPDLRTESQDVSSVWNRWIDGIISDYSIDGLRIDSVLEVNTGFWSQFQSAAGVYSLGEVYVGDSSQVCRYQDYLPGVFNYAMYFPLIRAFQSNQGSIGELAAMIDRVKSDCSDTSLLGTFSENHDQPRFAALNGDISLAKNVVAFTMLTDGIPVIYQGQEQHYNALGGQNYPYNREAIWLSKYNTNADLYKLVKKLNAMRKNAIADDSGYLSYRNTHVYSDYSNIAMRKGKVITVLSNVGTGGSTYTLNIPTGLAAATQMTEILTCDSSFTISSSGILTARMSGGVPRIYYPTQALNTRSGPCASGSKLKQSRHFRFD